MACILIIEDDPEINALMALTLRIENYDVLQARDGVEALRIAQDSLPDLILMDVMMPGMMGYDVADALREIPATEHIPIIFVTAKSGMEDRVRGLATGFDYICKPFAPPELLARVRVALRMTKLQEELRASNEKLAQLATTDVLTGLFNRRHFDHELEAEMQRAERYGHELSLLMFDIDFFKKVNDKWGHAQGDAVLREFARVLERDKRSGDLAARLGGEEFGVLLPATGLEGAHGFAERVRISLSQMPLPCIANAEQGPIFVTVSAGVAVYVPQQNPLGKKEFQEPTPTTPELEDGPRIVSAEEVVERPLSGVLLSPLARSLMETADTLLYRAKARGRNCVMSALLQVPHDSSSGESV